MELLTSTGAFIALSVLFSHLFSSYSLKKLKFNALIAVTIIVPMFEYRID